jgi:CheY-like chemotaxis protein
MLAFARQQVAAGQYVLIAVTDTGTGMSSEVAAQAIDPFFTTKEPGKGTGLGLSQVYGFVKQSKGHMAIYSEPGRGTTVRLYLPRAFEAAAARRAAPGPAAEAAPAPGAAPPTVLVVEDEASVRRTTVEALRELGYPVREADGSAAALAMLDSDPSIALLFTDVVMAKMDGRALARAATERRPDLKVLYTTGYTRNAIVHDGALDPDVDLLAKPFTIEQLARKLRDVLDR